MSTLHSLFLTGRAQAQPSCCSTRQDRWARNLRRALFGKSAKLSTKGADCSGYFRAKEEVRRVRCEEVEGVESSKDDCA